MALIVVALAAYGFDCQAMVTSDEAMQCCDSMPCPQFHGHNSSDDCCKTMPSLQAAVFVQPAGHSTAVVLALVAVLPVVSSSHGLDLSAHALLAAHSHAPPILQAVAPLPLRI